MKRLCYLGILKEGFSAYSSPVLLINRKMTQDKRVVTDFRHLNTRIAKKNLTYPLVKDTFKHWVIPSVSTVSIRFERCFSFIETLRKVKEILWYFAILWQCILFVSENVNGTKCFPTNLANLHKYNSQLLRE